MRPRLHLIELFAGTHSVSQAVQRSSLGRDFEVRVLSVDINDKFAPTVVADINRWDYEGATDNFLRGKGRADVVDAHASCAHFV